MITIDEKILDFLTGIHANRTNTTLRNEAIFTKAFDNACKDMWTHTVAYTPNAKNKYFYGDCTICKKNIVLVHKAICRFIMPLFERITSIKTQEEYNKWHSCVCNEIVNIEINIQGLTDSNAVTHNESIRSIVCHSTTAKALKKSEPIIIDTVFSYGQAQKLINMMLKYLYIYSKCEGSSELDSIKEWFHCPMDRYVLKASLNAETFNGTPWSQLTKTQYIECKKQIEAYVSQKTIYSTAFEWELAEWPFGIN